MPFGAIWANQQIRKAFTITGTPAVETKVAIGKIDEKLGDDDTLTDVAARDQVAAPGARRTGWRSQPGRGGRSRRLIDLPMPRHSPR